MYVKCTEQERMELWDDLKNTATMIHAPWGVVGDFNSINYVEEKLGGQPFSLNNNLDFISCIDDCGLQDASFSGPAFTWCDQRDPPDTIWKILDRLLYNSQWLDIYEGTCVTHLSRASSDHAHLLNVWNNDHTNNIKYLNSLMSGLITKIFL